MGYKTSAPDRRSLPPAVHFSGNAVLQPLSETWPFTIAQPLSEMATTRAEALHCDPAHLAAVVGLQPCARASTHSFLNASTQASRRLLAGGTTAAYFDASSKKNEAAGFVAQADKWAQSFEPQWRALLPPGITKFHMTDFVSSQNSWEDWKGTSAQRARLIERLVRCIRVNTRKGFAVTLQYKDYNDVNRLFTLKETVGDPYSFVGVGCAGMLRIWGAAQ